MYQSVMTCVLAFVWAMPFALLILQPRSSTILRGDSLQLKWLLFASILSSLILLIQWWFSFKRLKTIKQTFVLLKANDLVQLDKLLDKIPLHKCFESKKSLLKFAVDEQLEKSAVLFLVNKGGLIAYTPNATYNVSYTLFYLASYYDFVDEKLVLFLISKGADVNFIDSSRGFQSLSPLHAFILRGYVAIVDLLIRCGADLHYVIEDLEFNALMLAAKYVSNPTCEPMLRLLNQYGDNLNTPNIYGYTPILLAAEYNQNANAVRALCKMGARLEPVKTRSPNLNGGINIVTPLRQAVISNNYDVVYSLIEMNDDPLFKDSYGFTVLFLACAHNPDVRVIDLLLASGAKLEDSYDIEGNTPLMGAAYLNPSPEIIHYLAQLTGKDRNHRNNEGLTFIHYLKENTQLDEGSKTALIKQFHDSASRFSLY